MDVTELPANPADHAVRVRFWGTYQYSDKVALTGITHLVVASCTGFVAPGIDQIIAEFDKIWLPKAPILAELRKVGATLA